MLHSELTEKIIACSYEVYNRMGYGYLESVYEKCMSIELEAVGLDVETQKPLKVFYKGNIVGDFVVDMIPVILSKNI
jgi:GxxExxY protein